MDSEKLRNTLVGVPDLLEDVWNADHTITKYDFYLLNTRRSVETRFTCEPSRRACPL
jgi:hypothetical protein